MTSSEIRSRFLEFFEKRGHAIIPSSSLVTSDEKGITDTTLFNTAGMQPLVPYLLGKPHPLGKRLVNSQKCLRTIDIDDIGDKTHATFFEMLGNWSLGDYFKQEAINWSYEFLTSKSDAKGDRGLWLDPSRLYITVFEGDATAARDDEAANIWREVFKKNGIAGAETDTSTGRNNIAGRIFYLPAKNNWWEAGDNGPCGPDTEMYYDVKNTFGGKPITHEQFIKADESRDVVEVWNDVFMQYEKKDGKIVGKLPKPSVDTGAGLERLSLPIQGVDNIYDTDLLKGVLNITSTISKDIRGQRIVADHIRAATFLIADGVLPSNTDRGYILRRLIRRAVINTTAKQLNMKEIEDIVGCIVEIYGTVYPQLKDKYSHIVSTFYAEVVKFAAALDTGTKEFAKIAGKGKISGEEAFKLFSSYGLPIDVLKDLAKELMVTIDTDSFEKEFKKHQELSRSGAEKKFKGGLEGAAEGKTDPMVVRYHTATHLLHQALFDVLGDHVAQKGSNITPERLRFDFAHGAKMTDEQKKKVEDIVNEKISATLPVTRVVLPAKEAEKTGARHLFGEKYGDQVSVYFIGGKIFDAGCDNNEAKDGESRLEIEGAYSKEFCGGPHVQNTKELAGPDGKWKFKIQKEEAIAQGIRRIKAVLV
jgi:alanyl-tRNA synthetase